MLIRIAALTIVAALWQSPAPAPHASSTPPALDELLTLKLRNVSQALELAQYRAREAQAQYDKAIADGRALVSEFEAAHPGWTIDPSIAVVAKSPAAPASLPKGGG